MKRVVITGIGAVTPLGLDIEATWNSLVNRRSGISVIQRFDPSGLRSRIAGELKNFCPQKYMGTKEILRLDPFVHYAAASALMASADAGVTGSLLSGLSHAAAVIVGSSRGGITSIETAVAKHHQEGKPFSAYLMSSSTINMASSFISMKLGIKGPALGISTACASGTNAIGEAFRMIRDQGIMLAFAGGTEAPLCRLAVGGYGASGALSERNDDPEKASRPFDLDRDGFVIAEGAAILVLEDLNHALKRRARIYAEVAGYGMSSDAFHQTNPDPEGEATAIRHALRDADIHLEDVDYINAHATSTPLGDAAESIAVRNVFGKSASRIDVSSTKSMLGHMLGAAGSVEAAVTALSLHRNTLTPTINLDNPDPDCGLNYVTTTTRKEIHVAISHSFGFGGVNAVLVLKRFEG